MNRKWQQQYLISEILTDIMIRFEFIMDFRKNVLIVKILLTSMILVRSLKAPHLV